MPPVEDRLKTWTVDEVETMARVGLLEDPGRWELLDGQIVEKMGQGEPYYFGVRFGLYALQEVFGWRHPLVVQGPIRLSEKDAPEPDVAILTRETARPLPGEVLLVYEVGSATISRDLGWKSQIYARHGVPDYWVLDPAKRRLVVHRSPNPARETWADVRVYGPGDAVAPLARPDSPIRVADLLRGEDPYPTEPTGR